MTNKQIVLARFPKAHCYTAGTAVVILKEKLVVKPRGEEQGGSIIGTGSTFKRAWANAANTVRRSSTRKTP